MSILITPQERRTSEIPYHSDLAPGRRFVFVGRPVYPQSAFYVVGRRVEYVPKDQPEWLEDHRHNCNTFYVFIGDRDNFSGICAVVTVEGRSVEVHAPAAVLIPQSSLHHYRLVEGSGWSFHINLRGDYEESLATPGEVDASDIPAPAVEDIHKAAERQGGHSEVNPRRWSFIDGRFVRPGIRLTVYQVVAGRPVAGPSERHRPAGDGAGLVIGAPGETLRADVRFEGGRVQGTSPATIYHPEGVPYAYERMEGTGIILELEKA